MSMGFSFSSWNKITAPLRQNFEARNTRERIVIILLIVVSVWALAQIFYFDPATKREKLMQNSIRDARTEIDKLKAQEQVLRIELSGGTLAMLESKRSELLKKQAELDQQLVKQGLGLIDTAQMRQVLHDLLRGSNLDLVALRRLPSQAIFSTAIEQPEQHTESAVQAGKGAQQEPSKEQAIKLYRHPMQIELEGRYVDMVRYLERLEASPWRLMWQELDIETVEYPRARMRLTVYTLSLQEEWIGV